MSGKYIVPKVGDRIRLIEMREEPYHPVPSGSVGTIKAFDDSGGFWVDWDGFSSGLKILPDMDIYEVLPVKLLQKFYPDRKDVLWYGGDLFSVTDGHVTMTCRAVGDVYATLLDDNNDVIEEVKDKNNAGEFYGAMREHIAGDAHLQNLKDEGRLVLSNNNWMEYFFEVGGELLMDTFLEEGTDDVLEALQSAEETFAEAKSWLKEKVIVSFDLETTGLDTDTAEILQFAAIVRNYGCDEVFSELYRPVKTETWPEAEAINRISPEMVRGKYPFECYKNIDQIRELFERADIITGYNIKGYDLKILARYGIEVPDEKVFDCMTEFASHMRHKFGAAAKKRYKLRDAADLAGIEGTPEEYHEAAYDAKVSMLLYDYLTD